MTGGIHLDTSFLMSLLVGDAHAEIAREFTLMHGAPLVMNELLELEFVNGIAQRVFRGGMTVAQAEAAHEEFLRWKRSGRLIFIKTKMRDVWAEANKISRIYTAKLGTRSLDVLHVAHAVLAEAKLFASFDKKQRVLAEALRLKVNPL